MKPSAFEYYAPTTLTEALGLLAELGDETRPLAGGQSLVPMMNFRLARPSNLVDLNGVAGLSYLCVENGELRIGAMTRQRELEVSSVVVVGWPLLREATSYIGHVAVRNRGTVGGSLAHAFPSAELPMAMVTLDATFLLHSQRRERTIRAREFFVDYMTTVLEPEELLVEVRVPPSAPRTGWEFQEISQRHGDFALMGVAALLTLDKAGLIEQGRLTLTGPAPMRSARAEELLAGGQPEEGLFREAARLAAEDLEPYVDLYAGPEYRRAIGEVLARRVLGQAAKRALARESR